MKTYVKIYQLEGSQVVSSRHCTLHDVTADEVLSVLRFLLHDKLSASRPPGAGDPAHGGSTKMKKTPLKSAS
jgi:hypothetical protein